MENTKKAIVLISGGLDSATTLAIAKHLGFNCYGLSFDYKQRNISELVAAKNIAISLETTEHKIIKIDLAQIGGSALTDEKIDVPDYPTDGIPITYVPARNTLFLSYALAWAEVLDVYDIFIGVNSVDYSGYPDCRPEYFQIMGQSLGYGSKLWTEYNIPLQIEIPIIEMSKSDIVKLGLEIKAPLELTWSCYQGNRTPCGRCDSCILRANGFHEAGYADPAMPS